MPADPETMQAIHSMGDALRASIDARLTRQADEATEARQRIYDRIDSHALESRSQLATSTAELRGAMTTLGTQVTDLAARFGAHEKSDDREFARVDEEMKAASSKRHGYVQALVAAIFGGVAGWMAKILGDTH